MVFENILVRLLNQKIGHYIDGLDTKNLEVGIFSGNIVIENVKLKDTVPELLELPFDIKYSHIKKLILKIPITNLSGSPVEIELDGLYVLFDVQREVDWMQDYQNLKNKLEMVDQYAQDIIEKMIQVQTKQMKDRAAKGGTQVENQQTYVDRLIMKILDNLQLKISNIHIRIENQIGFKASFGICLQSIGMLTVNDHDEPVFIDRTKSSNANLAMTKKLDLKNLGVYVNPNEQKFLVNKSFEEIQLHLSYSIMKTGQKMNNIINYLFTINLQVRLVQNPKGDFRIPNIIVVADLNKLNFTLDQDQLQHAISMLEYMNAYNKHLTRLKESQCTKDLSKQNELIEKYKQIYPIYYYKQERNLDGLQAEQRKQLSEAIEKLPIKILLDQTKIIAGEQLKSQKINEITAQKKGLFSRIFGSSQKKNSIVTQKDKENIESFFESIIKQEDSQIQQQAQKTNAPDDYIWLKIKFKFEGGSIHLKKQVEPAEYKGACFSFSDLLGSVNVKMKGNSITASLKDMSVDIVEEQVLKQQKKITNVLGKSSYQQENNIIFFRMDTKQLQDKEERFVKFNLAQAKLQYNRLLIQLLTDFFEVKVQDQELRDQAMKKIEEFHEKTQQQVEESLKNIDKSKDILKLDVFLASPIIVIPFSSDENIDAVDFLVLQLGNLSIRTDHEEGSRLLQSNALIQDKIEYARKKELNETYLISLQNINCRYFSSIQTMEQFLQIRTFSMATHPSLAGQQRESFLLQQKNMQSQGEMFVLVSDFSINIKIDIAKYHQKILLNANIPRISLEGDVTDLNINLNQKVHLKLLSLSDVFASATSANSKRQTLQMNSEEYEKNNVEEIITEKKELIKKAIKGGFLFKRGKHIKKWEKYYAVLTRDHIYFFEVQNTLKPLFHITIRYASITSVAEDQCGFKNGFVIKTRYEDIYLGCEKAEHTEKWIKEIQKIYDENEEEKRLYEIQMNEQENNIIENIDSENTDFDQVDLLLNFKINSLLLNLEDMNQKMIADFSIQKFTVKAEKKIASFEAALTLEGIYVNDYIYQYQDPSLSYLITSRNEKNDKLIKITILQLDKQHPKHKQDKMDLLIDCEFGCLFVNFKPDSVMAIMDFFQIESEGQIIKQLEMQKQESQRREEFLLKQQGKDHLQNIIEGNEKVDTDKQGGQNDQSNLLENSEVILVKAKVHVKQIALNLVHRKTKLNQNQLNLQNTQIEFIQKADEICLSGSMQNLQIFDLTNYPNTIYKEEDYKFQRKQEMVGLWYETDELLTHINDDRPQIYDKKANLLNFTVTLIEPTSKKFNMSTRETIFIDAFINSIHVDYMMQPVMRLIDYLLVQVIGIVTAPEGFKEDANIAVSKLIDQKNQIQKNLEQQRYRISQLQKEFLKTQILNPTNMNIKIQIKSPVIDIKQHKDVQNYIRIFLGTTSVSNKRFVCPKRLLTNQFANSSPNYYKVEQRPVVYEDQYYIYIEDMKIVVIKDDQMLEICKPFDFNIKVSMMSFFKELEQCFPLECYDNTMTIESFITPILLKFSNFDYNIIMTGIFHNISYDDGLDQFFIHDFWATFAEKQKQMERKDFGLPQQKVQQAQQTSKKEKKEPADSFKFKDIKRFDSFPIDTNSMSSEQQYVQRDTIIDEISENSVGIYFSLDFQNISLFAVSNDGIPFAMVTFDNARIIYDSIDGKSNIKIICKEIDGSYFEKDVENPLYYEYPLIGSLVKFNMHDEQQIQDLEHLIKQIRNFDLSSDDIIDDLSEDSYEGESHQNINKEPQISKKKHEEHKLRSKKNNLHQTKHKAGQTKKHKGSGQSKSSEKIFSIPNFQTPKDIEKDLSKQPDFLFPSIENHLADLHQDKKDQGQFFFASQIQNALEFSYDSWEKTGEKEMYINLHNITIVAQMGILLQIAGFTKLNEETENVPPPIVPKPQVNPAASPLNKQGQMNKNQTINRSDSIQENNNQNNANTNNNNNNLIEGAQSKTAINVNNILICTPCMESGNILTLRGQFTVLMTSKQPKPLSLLRDLIHKGKITREELSQTNVIDEMDVKVEGLEIFICDYDEITHKDFRTVKKREILLPLKVFLSKKTFLSINDDLTQAIEKSLIDLSIQQSSLRISFQDIKLMQDVINYAMTQIEIYKERSNQIELEKLEKQKLKLLTMQMQIKDLGNNSFHQHQNISQIALTPQQVGASPQLAAGRRNSSLLNLNRSQNRMILKNPSSSKFQMNNKEQANQNEKPSQLLGKISDVASIMFKGNEPAPIQTAIVGANQQSQLQHQGSAHNLSKSNAQSLQQLDVSKDKINTSWIQKEQQGTQNLNKTRTLPLLELGEHHQQLHRMESMSKILQNSTTKLEYRNQSKKSIIMNEVFKANLQESKMNMLLEGFQIVIINDVGNAFTPVLDLMFFDLVMNRSSNVIVDKVNAQIQLGINYFNPKVSEWEPIIERVGLEMNYIKNEVGTTKELITFEPITEHFKCLQINISSQLIFILSKTFNSFKQEILQQEKTVYQDERLDEEKRKSGERGGYDSPHPHEFNAANPKKPQLIQQPDYSSSQKMKPVNEQKKIFSNIQQPDLFDDNQRYLQLVKKSQLLSQKIHNWEHQRFTLQQQNPNCAQILENVSHVSPYTIKNQIGHTVEIVSDFSYKYDIKSTTTRGSSILRDNQSTTFRVESKLDHFLKINYRGMTTSQSLIHGNTNTLNRSNKVKVFLKTDIFKLSSLKNIDLDKVKCQEIVLKISNNSDQNTDKTKQNNPLTPQNKVQGGFSLQQQNPQTTAAAAVTTSIKDFKFRVNSEVKLDINLNRKILIISSPYVFYNNTSIEIMIALQFKKYMRLLRIQPGKHQAIPIDYLFSLMSISLEDQENEKNEEEGGGNIYEDDDSPEPISKIEEIMKKRIFSEQISVEECGNQINQNFEIRIGKHFVLLKIQPDQVNRYKTIMTFEPPYRFKNCLPKPLRLQIINQNKYTTLDRKIYPNQFFEEFEYPLQKKIYIKIQLEGFFWSEEELIYEGEVLTKIKISDSYNSSYISAHQCISSEAYSCRNYYFYCKALLINETQHSLEFYTKNENKWNSRPMLVGGQFPVYYGERLDDNLVILGEESGSLMVIYDKKCPQKQNKEVAISGVGSTELQVKTKMTLINQQVQPVFLPIGVQVSLKEIEPKIGLFTKVITLSPRIILVNNTTFTIYAKQFQTNSNESGLILTVDQRKPLFWLESHKQLLQIGIHSNEVDLQKSYFEEEEDSIPSSKKIKGIKKSIEDFQEHEIYWSGGIEITSIGVVSMCIRDKQNQIVKFIRTDIRNDNSNIYVVIQEVEETQVPYLVANRCEDINIDIPMIPALIELDEKAFFAWDEPHINKNEKELDIILRVNNLNRYQDQVITVKPDQINLSKKVVIQGKRYADRQFEDMYVKYTIMVDGYTKVIIFENSSKDELVSQEEKAEFYKKTVREIKDNYAKTINQSMVAMKEEKKKDILQQNQPNLAINFTDALDNNQPNLAADISAPQIERYISVYFKKIGISVINNHSLHEKSQELLYIYMQNSEMIFLQKKENIIFQFKIKFLNIDNNTQMLVDFPVVLTPSHYQSHFTEENSKAFLNLLIEKNTCAYNMNLFNSIIFDIEPVTLKIEEEFVNKILTFVDQIVEGIQTPEENEADFRMSKIVRKSFATSIVTRKSIISNAQNIDIIRKPMFWEVQTLPDQSLPTYIDQIILSPININLSFKSKTRTNNNFALLTVLATALGVALSNIDDAPVTLKGIKLQNCFDTADGITDKLIQKYKEQALREVFHVLGSLNIIGNPIGFFNNIATGVQDFIEKPIEGLVHGPLEGGMGLALGTASLIKNVMAGTFNSVNKFAGSFSTGIAHLCMDEDFMRQREKMRLKKPKHILDGIEYGVSSIVNGVGRGVIDVFSKPIQGARNAGIKGFLKGTWQGVSGLVIKPLSGLLDAASKTAEGITNTATYFDDKPNQRRIRQIRPFYGVEQYFKEYNDIDAEMCMEITRFKGGRFKESTFLNAFILLDDELNQKGLILLKEALIFLEIRTRKRLWIVPANQLKSFQQVFDGINIFVNEDNKYLQDRKAFIQIKNQNYNKYVHEKLLAYLNLIQDL